MNYRLALLQIILLLIIWLVESLLAKVFRGNKKHSPIIWTILLWILTIYNIASPYWLAFPIAGWMIAAILLIIIQTVHYHEFIYRRFWPAFWRLSVFLAAIIFVGSLFCQHLPLV